MSFLEHACSLEPAKFMFISRSLAASVHCFIVWCGRCALWKSIVNSHRPALRVGRSSACAGAAIARTAIKMTRRRMADPRFGRAPSYSIGRAAAGGAERDELAVVAHGERRRVVNLQRMAKHLLDRIEGVDQCQVLDKLAAREAEEMRDPVADDAAVGSARR